LSNLPFTSADKNHFPTILIGATIIGASSYFIYRNKFYKNGSSFLSKLRGN
jgi:hypothetical protein